MGNYMQEKLWNTYQFAEINTIVTQQTLIIVIEIPLISKTRFECFEIIALPFTHNEQDIILTKLRNNIWINDKEDIFMPNKIEN